MRTQLVVTVAVALLIGALAGVEWWAEHHWPADAVVRPAAAVLEPGLPDSGEAESEASASPAISR